MANYALRVGALGVPSGPGNIVCDGDSLTEANYAVAGSWPLLLEDRLDGSWDTRNTAIAGQTLASMQSSRADVDALINATSGYQVNVCFGGTNDIYNGADAATIQSRIQTYCEASRVTGFRVMVCTLLPRNLGGGEPITTAQHDTLRMTVNTWLRANYTTFADALVDIAADSRIGVSGAQDNTTYYRPDGTHLENPGRAVVAEMVADKLTTAIA